MISGVSLEGWIRVARTISKPARMHAIPLQRDRSLVDIADTPFVVFRDFEVIFVLASLKAIPTCPGNFVVGIFL